MDAVFSPSQVIAKKADLPDKPSKDCPECGRCMSPVDTVEDYLNWRCPECNTTDIESFYDMDDKSWEWVRNHLSSGSVVGTIARFR
jgi:hypothetical protein